MMNIKSKYRYSITILLLIIFSPSLHKAQTPESIRKDVDEARKVSSQHAAQAISMFTKILKESEKIKFNEGILSSKDALATIYFNNGEYEKVIKISSGVEALALKLNDFGRLAGIYRNLAASYSMLRLNDQALQTLDKAKLYAEKIEDKTIRHYTTALIYDSYSVCIGEANQDADKMIYYVNKSLEELAKISDEDKQDYVEAKYDLTGFQYFRLADLYYSERKQNSKAEEYYQKALKIYEDPKNNILPSNKVILYSSLSDFYYAQKDYNNSVLYGEKALELTRNYDHPEMRKDIYNNLFKAYLETGEKDKSKHYADLYTKLSDSLKKTERKSVNTSVNKIISDNKKISQKNTNKIILGAAGTLIFCTLLTFLLWRNNDKQVHKRYKNLIESIRTEKEIYKKEAVLTETDEEDKNQENDFSQKSVNIAPETVEALLLGLNKFEKSSRFLKKDVSLGYLVNYLGTNSKYLTNILKQYKKKSFNQYINDLRIEYIIRLLYEDPKYREYKISYLAEECGFSSREIFTIAFKKRTGISPSYFIDNLRETE